MKQCYVVYVLAVKDDLCLQDAKQIIRLKISL